MTTIEEWVRELEVRVDGIQEQLAQFKTSSVSRVTEVRRESKSYAAETQLTMDGLQDQLDIRFDVVNSRLDALNQMVEKTYGAINHLVLVLGLRTDPGTEDGGTPE